MAAHRSRETLVIHPGALGDVLQAVPALAALRAAGIRGQVALAAQTRIGRMLVGTGRVDSALPFDGLGLDALFASDPVPAELEARFSRFDAVVSWFGARSEPFASRLRGLVPGAIVAPAVPDGDSPLTVWEHLLATLAPWGVSASLPLRPLVIPEAWRHEARRTLASLGVEGRQPLLAVHPGAGGKWKQWPPDRLARVVGSVARETGCRVLVHQGPADSEAAAELRGLLNVPAICLVEPELDLLAALLKEASAYLGSDSGVSHLAAAVGAAAVILFPPLTRSRWAPWSPTAVPLEVKGSQDEVESIARTVGECVTARAGMGK